MNTAIINEIALNSELSNKSLDPLKIFINIKKIDASTMKPADPTQTNL